MAVKKKEYKFFNWQRVLISLSGFFGLAISVYLTYIHYASAKSFCDISENISCDVVTTSIYSEVFGVPMSVLGVGYFTAVLLLMLFQKSPGAFKVIFFLTLFVLMPSLYLTGTEIFIIKTLCPLCETSKALMVGILIVSFFQLHQKLKLTLRMAAPVLIAGIVAAAVTYFAQTGNVTNKDYSEFVDSLNSRGVVYYKSVKCSNCKRQEKLFGKTYIKLKAVECQPEGPNPQPELCLRKGIKKTPTFLLEKDGVEIKRLEGLQMLEKIANWAEVPFK